MGKTQSRKAERPGVNGMASIAHTNNPIRQSALLKLLILSLMLILTYHSALEWLFLHDLTREDYSHGYIIPAVIAYIIWEKRDVVAQMKVSPNASGFLLLFLALFLFFVGELGGEFFTLYFSIWLSIVALIVINLGYRCIKTFVFPLMLVLTMFPPPAIIHNNLTLQLKIISSKLGVYMLHLYGMSAYREGNIIDLGFTQLQVVDACSGLRYLFPLFMMGLLLAYFYRAAFWKKVLLVVSAIPLTIVTNSLRIAMTGVLYEIWGPAVAEDFFHGFSGWLIFIFGLAVLLLEMWVLSGFRSFGKTFGSFGALRSSIALKEKNDGLATDPHGHTQTFSSADLAKEKLSAAARQAVGSPSSAALLKPAEAAAKETAPDAPIAATDSTIQRFNDLMFKAFLNPPQFIVAVVLLAATLVAAQGIEFREKIPTAKSFAEFPQMVGDWAGKRDVMDQKFIDGLHFNDYIIVDYVNGAHAVNFYTAYYESQSKGESIHSPETCLPGSGWEFKNAGSVTLPLTSRDGKPMRVNKAFMEKGAYKQLSYFWFPQRDRVLTNAWELKIYNFWDALTRQRTDGALVRLITPVYSNEDVAQAEQRLTAFTQAIVPVLNEYLPK